MSALCCPETPTQILLGEYLTLGLCCRWRTRNQLIPMCSPAYNFSGSHEAKYNQFVSPPFNFTLTPDKVFGVA